MADDISRNPTFIALPSKADSEWYLLVSWHDGRVPQHVSGFRAKRPPELGSLKVPDWLQNRGGSTADASAPNRGLAARDRGSGVEEMKVAPLLAPENPFPQLWLESFT